MRAVHRGVWVVCVWVIGIGCRDPRRSPANESPGAASTMTARSSTPEAATVETVETAPSAMEPATDEPSPEPERDACRYIVLDKTDSRPGPRLGLAAVRAEPRSQSAKVGELPNGTVLTLAERRDGWARIEEPVAGWIYRALLYSDCGANAVLPVLVLGSRTFALLGQHVPYRRGGAALSPLKGQEGEPFAIVFSLRPSETEAPVPPLPVTIVSDNVACETQVIRSVVIQHRCPDPEQGDPEAERAWEVRSCPTGATSPTEQALILGAHSNATYGPRTGEERALTSRERRRIERQVERKVRRMIAEDIYETQAEALAEFEGAGQGIPSTGFAYEDSSLVSAQVLDDVVFLRGTSLAGTHESMAMGTPGVIRDRGRVVALTFSYGFHGYGLGFVPNHHFGGRIRTLWRPNFTCGAY